MPDDPSAESAEQLFNKGLDHHDRGEIELAIACYRRAVEIEPGFVVAHNNLGMVCIDKEDYQEAISALARTIELDPAYAEAYNNLGFVYRKLGEDLKAAAYYVRYLEIQPDIEDAGKIGGWLEQVRGRLGEIPQIGPDGRLQELAPEADEPEADEAFADSEARTLVMPPGSQLAAAVREASGAGEPAARNGTIRSKEPDLRASAPTEEAPGPSSDTSWLEDGAYTTDGAAAAVSGPAPQPLPASPPAGPAAPASAGETAAALCEKGIAEFERGELDAAEDDLRRAVAMDPGMAVARSGLGRVLAKAGRHEEAATELQAATGLDPADAAAYYVLGFTLRKLERDLEAADAYERFLDLTPDAKEGAQIREWMADVREAPPSAPGAFYTTALTSFQDGDVEEALEALESALAMDESHVEANVLMGRILVQKGDCIRAVPVLKRAAALKPENPEVYFYLAQAYDKRNLAEDARAAYEKCLEVAPQGPQAEAVREWLESARAAETAKARARCEYCFRPFSEDELSTHEGKKICPDCLANLGSTAPSQAPAIALPQTVVEQATAADAARTRRGLSTAKIKRAILTGVLSLVLAAGIVLLLLQRGIVKGPFVDKVIGSLGLTGFLKMTGWRPSDDGPRPLPGDGDGEDTGVDPLVGGGGFDVPRAEPLKLAQPATLVARPFKEFTVPLEAEGGRGKRTFRLVSGPDGVRVDPETGLVRWNALASAPALELPSRHEIEVEVSTADGEKSSVRFRVVVDLGFRKGPVLKTWAGPGDRVCLAVGKLNVTRGRRRDDIAVAWGRYREGSFGILYQLDVPGQFAPMARPVSLGGQPSALVLADFTGDGRTDAVVANWYRSRLHVFRQDETGVPVSDGTLPTAQGVGDIAAGDVDGDGRTDLIAAHWTKASLYVYRQQPPPAGDAPAGRLGKPTDYLTNLPSGWNRVFVGPLRQSPGEGSGGGRRAVYLMCGSGEEPLFKMFPVLDGGRLDYYHVPESAGGGEALLRARPLDARLVRSGDGPPCIAALIGGERPELHVIGAKGGALEVVARPVIDFLPFPAAFTVADLNDNGADDLVVLYPGKLVIYLSSRASDAPAGGPYLALPPVELPTAAGPMAVGDLTGDGRLDVLVALEDGRLQIVLQMVKAGGAGGAGEAGEGGAP